MKPPNEGARPAGKQSAPKETATPTLPAERAAGNRCVSMVASAASTETRDADAAEIVRCIRAGEWREPIEKVRATFRRVLNETEDLKKAKAAIDAAKKKLPGFIPTGQFSSREKPAAKRLLKHSGLFCADLDNLGERLSQIFQQIVTSPFLFALFLSPTGYGLKAIFRVQADPSRHAAVFHTAQAHVRELCGEEIDESC